MLLAFTNPFKVFKYGLTGVFLFIDGIVYFIISKLFALYESLATVEFITQDIYQDIADKFYVIIGVIMLFYLAYALLKSLINPDDLGKNTSKIVKNAIISLFLLGVVPTIFSYAFELQKIIIEEHIIDNLIFGEDNNSIGKKGNKSAMNVLGAFLNSEDANIDGEGGKSWLEFKSSIGDEYNTDVSFLDITDFAEPIHDGDASYIAIISTIAGCFLGYVLISFCLDLGIRVAKLAFYQIIAPIPILMRIIPEKKSVFDNYIKGSLATYMEVFVRLFIMYIVIFLTAEIFNQKDLFSTDIGFIGNVVIILGLFAFAKQAPKLIGDVIGIDSGNIKLGIGGKLAAAGAFGIGAVLGGATKTGLQNITKGVKNVLNTSGGMNKFNAGRRAVGSFIAGTISGGVNAGKLGWSAKNFKEARKAAAEGADAAINKRDVRENYRATHGNTTSGVAVGHVRDFAKKFGEFSGINASLKELQGVQSKANEVKNSRKAIDDKLTSLLNKYKDSMTTAGAAVDTGFTDNAGKAVKFSNYATLLNEMEIMKSTGKMSDGVTTATADMLTKMSRAEFELKEQMKKEILEGYDLRSKAKDVNGNPFGPNHKFSEDEFKEFYDGELQSLVTDYRTKSLQNANIISSNADKSIASVEKALNNFTEQVITNQNQKLYEFVASTNVTKLFDKSKDAISSATGKIDNAVNQKFQEQAKKDGK